MTAAKQMSKPASKNEAGVQAKGHESPASMQGKAQMKSRMNKSGPGSK
jgi:hypothetical protein